MENEEIVMPWKEWETERLLGRGSYGEVYQVVKGELGTQIRAAVKIMRIPADSSEIEQLEDSGISAESYLSGMVSDITNEIMVMQTLKGAPNIVSIDDYEIIKTPDRLQWTIYIRMELLTDLNRYRRKNPLTYEQSIRMGCDLCNALEICRRRNVIHRDIKPSNIFVSQFGEFKLGDFGISKHTENTQSAFSTRKGTYSYMAPEVYRGERYDYSIDIYSLGIVLYQMTNNGRLPFYPPAGTNVMPGDAELAQQKRNSGVPFPDPANGGKKLGNILRKACNIDPEKRYHSPASMREDLKKLITNVDTVRIELDNPVSKPGGEVHREKAEIQERHRGDETIPDYGSEKRVPGKERDKTDEKKRIREKQERKNHYKTILVSVSLLLGITLIGVSVLKNKNTLLSAGTVRKEAEANLKTEATGKESIAADAKEEKKTEVAAETEPVKTTEEKIKTETETKTEKVTEAQTETEKSTETATETETETEKATETETETEKVTETETEKATETETETEKATEAQTETETEKVTETETEKATETETETETEKVTETETETEKATETETETETEKATETETETETEKATEAQTETEKATETEAISDPVFTETRFDCFFGAEKDDESSLGKNVMECNADFPIDTVKIYEASGKTSVSSEYGNTIVEDSGDRFYGVYVYAEDGIFYIQIKAKDTGKQLTYYNIPLNVNTKEIKFHEDNDYTYVTCYGYGGNKLPAMERYKVKTLDKETKRYVITGSGLNVRKQPDNNENGEIIKKLAVGDEIEVCGLAKGRMSEEESDWYLVRLEDGYGYISADADYTTEDKEVADQKVAEIKAAQAAAAAAAAQQYSGGGNSGGGNSKKSKGGSKKPSNDAVISDW